MKIERNLEIVAFGSPDLALLTEEEQEHFYATLLSKIVDLYKKDKANEEQCIDVAENKSMQFT